MMKLSELQSRLSIEKKMPKNERNNALIVDLQEQISNAKKIVQSEFRKRQQEKRNEEISLALSLWNNKTERYKKIREAKKKEQFAEEKHKVEKIQQKKKVK